MDLHKCECGNSGEKGEALDQLITVTGGKKGVSTKMDGHHDNKSVDEVFTVIGEKQEAGTLDLQYLRGDNYREELYQVMAVIGEKEETHVHLIYIRKEMTGMKH